MPSIRILTRLSVVSLLGIQLFIETTAYPILEKDKDIKRIKPRLFKKGGKSKPILGGALLAGGGILAYSHFKGGNKNPPVVIPSEPLSSSNGGPTASPFLTDTASSGSTDPAAGDPGVDAGTGTGTGALPGTEVDAGVATGGGAAAGAVPGAVPATAPGTVPGTVPATVPATVPGTPQGAGAGVGTGTVLAKKDIIWRGEYGALVPRSDSKISAVKSGLGSVATVVIGSAVLNLFSGIVSGRNDRKAQQAAIREAAADEFETEPEENTPNNAKTKSLNTSANESMLPSNSDLKSKTRRPIDEYQTE